MITDPEVLQNQQVVLALLGFYTGVCDGIWGPATIAAKKRFEADPRYRPAVPTFGMPIVAHAALPAVLQRDPKNPAMLQVIGASPERVKEICDKRCRLHTNAKPRTETRTVEVKQPVQEQRTDKAKEVPQSAKPAEAEQKKPAADSAV